MQRRCSSRRIAFERLEPRHMLSTDGTLFVDVDASGAATGENWDDAFPSLQAALDRAEALNADGADDNDVTAVWIAEGTYRPTAQSVAGKARTETFRLLEGVSLYGAFAGDETSLEERLQNPDGTWVHETILSGDLLADDDPTDGSSYDDNAYTVVYASTLGQPATLDGLTITRGRADGTSDDNHPEWRQGGGLYVFASEVTVSRSRLSANWASERGGGIYNRGTLTVTGSTISANAAGDEDGGGIYNGYDGTLTVTDSTIAGNEARWHGGGICSDWEGTLTVTGSTISGNSTEWHDGGGIWNGRDSTLTVTNSTISDNYAGIGYRASGGGLCNDEKGTVHLENTIIAGNTAGTTAPDFAGEAASQGHNLIGDPSGSSGWLPNDLLDVAPLLGPLADNGGPTLTHALLAGSPAIDAGDPEFDPHQHEPPLLTDQRGRLRIVDGNGDGTARLDIGAYEFGAPLPAEVVARQVFYNDSAFDGNDPAANGQDDAAIAPYKKPLLPGGTAEFENYTSYEKGINGLAIDIAGLPASALYATDNPDTSDFEFRLGNDDHPESWRSSFDPVDPVPLPSSVTVAEDIDGQETDRVKLIWDDYAIVGQWLQVRVLTTERTGLEHENVFYFGNAPGEAGDSDGHAIVNTTDEILIRDNLHGPRNPAELNDAYDYNRDRLVNVTDRIIARGNRTGVGTALRLINPPEEEAGAGGGRLSPAIGHDVVLERAARQQSTRETASLGKLAWLADSDCEQLFGRRRSANKERPAARAIDKLLASCRP